jgi:hypothetical protein
MSHHTHKLLRKLNMPSRRACNDEYKEKENNAKGLAGVCKKGDGARKVDKWLG